MSKETERTVALVTALIVAAGIGSVITYLAITGVGRPTPAT